MVIDRTHAVDRRSWVRSANGHPEFPIQNLPLGVFSPMGGRRRVGVAIGDEILDVAAALAAGLFEGMALEAAALCRGETLNELMAAPPVTAARVASRGVGFADGGCLRPTRIAAPLPRAGLHDAPPGAHRRLHRLLRGAASRGDRGAHAQAEQSAAAELQACSHRLQQPRFDDRRVARPGTQAVRPDRAHGRHRADQGTDAEVRLRIRGRCLDRLCQPGCRAHRYLDCRGGHLWLLPAQ